MNKRVLLDTNILIHRENKIVTNYSIGHLYRWLDKLHYVKMIHPASIKEIDKYQDAIIRNAFDVKLEAYEVIKTPLEPSQKFIALIERGKQTTPNDLVDDSLLYELYCKRVDILITEDRALIKKAQLVNLEGQVFTIDSFLLKVTDEHPGLVEYKVLSVVKKILD